jgi:hypothetical protein
VWTGLCRWGGAPCRCLAQAAHTQKLAGLGKLLAARSRLPPPAPPPRERPQVSGNHRLEDNRGEVERCLAAGHEVAPSTVEGKPAGPIRCVSGLSQPVLLLRGLYLPLVYGKHQNG